MFMSFQSDRTDTSGHSLDLGGETMSELGCERYQNDSADGHPYQVDKLKSSAAISMETHLPSTQL